MTGDSLRTPARVRPRLPISPLPVVSMADHRLWYAGQGGSVRSAGCDRQWQELSAARSTVAFETPRGRLTVKGKDEDPAWVPPDWHYVEQAPGAGTSTSIRASLFPPATGAS
jgi:hypothetical protein